MTSNNHILLSKFMKKELKEKEEISGWIIEN